MREREREREFVAYFDWLRRDELRYLLKLFGHLLFDSMLNCNSFILRNRYSYILQDVGKEVA